MSRASALLVRANGPFDRFVHRDPFPLSLGSCERQQDGLRAYVLAELNGGGLRFGRTRAEYLLINLAWLEKGGWSQAEREFLRLSEISPSVPAKDCVMMEERHAARAVAKELDGIGPKQARNLWQC